MVRDLVLVWCEHGSATTFPNLIQYVVQHATTVDREALVWLSGTAPGAARDVPYRYGCFASCGFIMGHLLFCTVICSATSVRPLVLRRRVFFFQVLRDIHHIKFSSRICAVRE